jgi:ABC-type cobalt transport system substrate-binding protein
MITLIVTIVVVWTVIRIVQFVTRLWSGADAAGSPRIGVIAAA